MSAQKDNSQSPLPSSDSPVTSPNVSQALPAGEQVSEKQTTPGEVKEDTTSQQQNGTGGPVFKIVTVNGERFFEYPVSVSTEEHLNNLRNMPLRQDDVIIAAFPKSGQSTVVFVVVVVIVVMVMVMTVIVVVVEVAVCWWW